MKGPATGVNFNQTTLIGKKNKVQQSFLISKIKNVPQASKLAAKKPPQVSELYVFCLSLNISSLKALIYE